jgi:hypothetical protein
VFAKLHQLGAVICLQGNAIPLMKPQIPGLIEVVLGMVIYDNKYPYP